MSSMHEDRATARNAIIIVVAAVLVALGMWWFNRDDAAAEPQVVDPPEVASVSTLPEEAPPAIQYPIEAPPEAAAPVAEETPRDPDVVATDALNEVFGAEIAGWLVNDQVARRLVATLDNLPRQTRIEQLRPLRAPATPFVVERETIDAAVNEERIVLSAANYARYDAPVALLANTDAAGAAQVYRRVYPQLQAAYEDLGYPGRYFNDRVVAVIDHLLTTPEPQGELLLEQPKVLYRFADANLESLSPGQKLLLRIGPGHARTVKQKLREFRAAITAAPADNNKE